MSRRVGSEGGLPRATNAGVESLGVVGIGLPSLEAKEPKAGHFCVCIGKEWARQRAGQSLG